MKQLRVGVVMGGQGVGRETSVKSGEAAAAALKALGHQVTRVLAGPGLDLAMRGAQLDVAFLSLHDGLGQDGRVQGLLEVQGLRYTGSGVLASSLAWNRAVAQRLFRQHNLATPVGYTVGAGDAASLDARHLDLGFPCLVWPAQGRPANGPVLVMDPAGLKSAVRDACAACGEALVERLVPGKTVSVALLDGQVLGCAETGARPTLSPRLSETRRRNVESLALAAARALGCRGAVMVELVCSESANDVVLAVDTQPSLAPKELFARLAHKAGLYFLELVHRQLASSGVEVAPLPQSEEVAPRPTPQRHAG